MRAEDGWWRDQGDDVMNSDDNNDSAMDRPKDTQETYATAEEDDDEVYSV